MRLMTRSFYLCIVWRSWFLFPCNPNHYECTHMPLIQAHRKDRKYLPRYKSFLHFFIIIILLILIFLLASHNHRAFTSFSVQPLYLLFLFILFFFVLHYLITFIFINNNNNNGQYERARCPSTRAMPPILPSHY